MEFNRINNTEYYSKKYYPLDMTSSYDRSVTNTPQINEISMHMPSSPVLYQWDKVPKVSLPIVMTSFRLKIIKGIRLKIWNKRLICFFIL